MRRGGSKIGWIPSGFVHPVSLKMGERLRSMGESFRIFEVEAEQLYSAATISYTPNLLEPRSCSSSPASSPRTYQHQLTFCEVPFYDTPSIKRSHSRKDKENVRTSNIGASETNLRGKRDVVVVNNREALDWLSNYITSGPTNKALGEGELTNTISGSLSTDTPWYLRPRYAGQLQLDSDGSVEFGTPDALVEKLIHNTNNSTPQGESVYRNVFLATFRTFMAPEDLFERLKLAYNPTIPDNMTQGETDDWKEKWLARARRNVLIVFTCWLEDHQLLEEEPHIARRLTDFLHEIQSPTSLVVTAGLILQSIERLTFASPITSIRSPSPNSKSSKRRKQKSDLLRLDHGEFAEQLTIFEYTIYSKIKAAECVRSIRSPHSAPNIARFCSDVLGSWVKWSILMEGTERRSHMIDFWIKTAEKCRLLNNYNSMFHIVTALSSTVISQLQTAWNHVGRKFTWEALHSQNDPSGGFAGHRSLLRQVEGPCVPFIVMFLADLVYLHEKFKMATSSDIEATYICFAQKRRYYNVISMITTHQNRPYAITDDPSTQDFIRSHLRFCQTLSDQWFIDQAERILSTEAHVPKEVKKGLEAAGF